MPACIWKLDVSHFQWQSCASCMYSGRLIIPWLYRPSRLQFDKDGAKRENIFFTMMQHRLSHVDIRLEKKTSKTWSMRELSGDDHSSFEIDKIASLCYIHFVWHFLEVRFFELWRRWLLVCLTRVIGYTFENMKLWLKQISGVLWRKKSWKIRVHDKKHSGLWQFFPLNRHQIS